MMKLLAALLITLSFGASSNEPVQEWEALDLEEAHLQEMKKRQKQEYEDREGDLQIQAEEEEIIPLESEDSRNLEINNENNEEE